ncbi:hypothetical protein C2845_PM01G00210 [Panicum miliaceum]|uniref:Uncharacterized protein n=1 Tax=Panicum miliaceum TaxID=4540 RepID=A0A3L6TK75_PANMI|nr:hypothetical protein C2845_PM01G00210 [Panicum miliaceum]
MFRFRRSVTGGGNESVVSGGDQSQSRSRSSPQIYGPRNLEDDFLRGDPNEESRAVLAKIGKCYNRLKNPQLGYGGFCFGLLDPASNIYVNSVMAPDVAARVAATARGGDEAAADMIQRSLDGLLAFLTRLFPCLPNVEAVRYLDAAEADPLVASLFIINRRGIEQSFTADSDTTVAAVEAALRCAAVAARHPDPQKLVLVWKLVSLSPGLKNLQPRLQCKCDQLLLRLDHVASDPALQLKESWELTKSRLRRAKPRALPPTWAARKRVLLARIHRFYLDALARLPKDELCSRYHHSLLKAGHCYGPLDPVSNIIINTIWYGKAYPPSKQFAIQMISTRCLMRIVARSFYGLVSFMCARYPDRTVDQILQRLQEANADLRVADPTFGDMLQAARRNDNTLSFSCNFLRQVSSFSLVGGRTSHPGSLQVAYNAAATAASHPVPHQQEALLGLPDSVHMLLQLTCTRVMRNDRILSSENVETIATFIMPPFADELYQQQPHPAEPEKPSNLTLCFHGLRWTSITPLSCSVILCVNERVSGPEYNMNIGYNPGNPLKYYHSHINFLATCQDPQSVHASAKLFFAECGNYSPNESWCLPMNLDQDTEHVRCIYCEKQGITIVHPAVHGFHGRDIEFEKVLLGERLFRGSDASRYTNNRLYVNGPDRLGHLEDDYIYSDYVLDPARKVEPEKLLFLFMK